MSVIVIATVCGLAAWFVFAGKGILQPASLHKAATFANRFRQKRSPSKSGSARPVEAREKLVRYDDYPMTGSEIALSLLGSAAVLFAVGFLFYKNVAICLLLSSAAVIYPPIRRKQKTAGRQEELKRQFKHALHSLSSSLAAGKSVENAFRDAVDDLRLLYPDKHCYMIAEFEIMNRRIENGEPIERALQDFSMRASVEEIAQFADVFAICKRTGGDLIEVVRRTALMIGEKMDVQQEISVLVAQKRFEAKALGFVPYAIVGFLTFSSPDYMAPLYQGGGHVVATAALVLLGFSHWLAFRMMDIRV